MQNNSKHEFVLFTWIEKSLLLEDNKHMDSSQVGFNCEAAPSAVGSWEANSYTTFDFYK